MVTGKLEKGAWQDGSRSLRRSAGGFSRTERGNLAPFNLIFHNETDWVCILVIHYTAVSSRMYLGSDLLRRVNFMVKPNGRLVLVSYTHYCASTSSLSTRWSSWALLYPFGLGDLILRSASRLYAFSGYHNRTSLPSRAFGKTTGTQEVRPSRSSRTKDRPSQISYAHSR